jgi:hypothetical protein
MYFATRPSTLSEYLELLEGMLFGYDDWQNDWWIERGVRRGGFGGAPLCCAVTADGLAWLEAAGFRALIAAPVLAGGERSASAGSVLGFCYSARRAASSWAFIL